VKGRLQKKNLFYPFQGKGGKRRRPEVCRKGRRKKKGGNEVPATFLFPFPQEEEKKIKNPMGEGRGEGRRNGAQIPEFLICPVKTGNRSKKRERGGKKKKKKPHVPLLLTCPSGMRRG